MEEPISNPYVKGKAKLIADVMLEGWGNEKIWNHINKNKLDAHFKNPITMNVIYKVRGRFHQLGITEKMAQLEQTDVPTPNKVFQKEAENGDITKVPHDSERERDVPDGSGRTKEECARAHHI